MTLMLAAVQPAVQPAVGWPAWNGQVIPPLIKGYPAAVDMQTGFFHSKGHLMVVDRGYRISNVV